MRWIMTLKMNLGNNPPEPKQVLSDYVKPKDVLSPKDRVRAVVKVLYDGGENSLSVAILDYVHENVKHDPEAVAIRWNGSADDTLGFPSVRQYPVWFLLPDELAPTVKFLAENKFQFKLPFNNANATRFMAMFGSMFDTESLAGQLKSRGYKVTLEK
jgi:hypothetical protein